MSTDRTLGTRYGTFQIKQRDGDAGSSSFLSEDELSEIVTPVTLDAGKYIFSIRKIEWSFEGYVFPALPIQIDGSTPTQPPSTYNNGLPNFIFTSSAFEPTVGQENRGTQPDPTAYSNFPVCPWKNDVVPYPQNGRLVTQAGISYVDYVYSSALNTQTWDLTGASFITTIGQTQDFYWNWRCSRPYSSVLFDHDVTTLQNNSYAWFGYQSPNNPSEGLWYAGYKNSDFVVTIDYARVN